MRCPRLSSFDSACDYLPWDGSPDPSVLARLSVLDGSGNNPTKKHMISAKERPFAGAKGDTQPTATGLTNLGDSLKFREPLGAVAQLGERRVRNAEVRGSIPLGSTLKACDVVASLFLSTTYIFTLSTALAIS